MPEGDGLVAVGRIGKPHGLRGDVTVEVWTDDPTDRFAPGRRLAADRGPQLSVDHSRYVGSRLTVGFDGVESREAAEALRGIVVSVPLADRPALSDPDEFYDSDLEGLAARDPSGRALGTVQEIVHGPGADTLVVLMPDGREQLVPFVAAIVPSVDVSAGVVVIDPPEGLFDL